MSEDRNRCQVLVIDEISYAKQTTLEELDNQLQWIT